MAERRSGDGQGIANGGLWLPASPENHHDRPEQTDAVPPNDNLDDGQIQTSERGFVLSQPGRALRTLVSIESKLARPLAWLARQWAIERERGGRFLWAAVAYGVGCAGYFSLPREPLILAFPLLLIVLAVLAWRAGVHSTTGTVLLAGVLVCAGVSSAQWQTLRSNTIMMERTVSAMVTGRVIQTERRANGRVRYTIDVGLPGGRIELRQGSAIPKLVRLTDRRGGPNLNVGEWVKGLARVGPPPGPSFPGAYDFSFQNWFAGIGGSGFFLGHPQKHNVSEAFRNHNLGLEFHIAKAREAIALLILNALPGRNGGLATALIVGDRSGIDEQTSQALRRSGLAHILAISGLHMGLVALTVVLLVRTVLSFFPAVLLHYPVKKWASVAGLVCATVYLGLSGANVSTQRAYIMVGIMLFAVLVDRKALTMRNVALAAFLVLALAPDAVLLPGFQMSFAAVAALIGVYEVISRRRQLSTIQHRAGTVAAVGRFVKRDIGGLALTSLVAGLATALFAAFHFYRVAPYGLLANLLAMPLITFMVMPLALLSVLFMPFGLEFIPLAAMAYGLEWVTAIAHGVADLEPRGVTGYVPISALLFATIALLTATLMRSWLKIIAAPFVVAAAFSMGSRHLPDVLILENGNQIGILNSQEAMVLLRPNAEKFHTSIWSAAFPSVRDKTAVTNRDARSGVAGGSGFRCDDFGCSVAVKGVTIVHAKTTSRLYEDCIMADVLVVPFFVNKPCDFVPNAERPLVVDRGSLNRTGALALSISASQSQPESLSDNPVTRSTWVKSRISIVKSYPDHPRPWNKHRVEAQRHTFLE